MIKYTSNPLTLTVKGYDLTSASIYVNISQPLANVNLEISSGITKTKTTVDGVVYTTLSVPITQAQKGSLNEKHKAEVQVNFVISGTRYATLPKTISVIENLKEGTI